MPVQIVKLNELQNLGLIMSKPTTDEQLREQLRQISLTPINDIYFVPPGISGSWSLPDEKLDEIMHLITQARKGYVPVLTAFEVQDYKRLKDLESRDLKEYDELRKAPALTAERVLAFINQLSPWNLKTIGISVLEAYTQAELDQKVVEAFNTLRRYTEDRKLATVPNTPTTFIGGVVGDRLYEVGK